MTNSSVDEQLQILMRGVDYGDPHIYTTMRDELRQRLTEGRPLRVYCGFDPTSTDLTVGNLVPMLKMRQFQRLGHQVTFLFGTMTGIVGDPSDKTAARQMLTIEQVESNAREWLRQVYRVLDKDKTIVKRNGDWLGKLTLADVIDLGSHFTVAQFLERDTFAKRMEEHKPIYVHEFLYALMQARDAVELETDVQIGGVDQLFNIMAGRILQRDLGQRPLVVLTTPLLIGTDGHLKMSKSTGNYIGLDDAPADMYGKVMSIPDSLILNYFVLLTEVPSEELEAIEKALDAGGGRAMELKKRLAREIVGFLNGEEAAAQAQAEFERAYQRRESPEAPREIAFSFQQLERPESEVPDALIQEFRLSFEQSLVGEVSGPMPVPESGDLPPFAPKYRYFHLPEILVAANLATSISAARRLIEQGAIHRVKGRTRERITGPFTWLENGTILRVGRQVFLKVVDTDSG